MRNSFRPTTPMFHRIIDTEVFNPALGFATCLEENSETIGAKGGFWIHKVTVRKAAVDSFHNTWTQHVETFFVLRDMATDGLKSRALLTVASLTSTPSCSQPEAFGPPFIY